MPSHLSWLWLGRDIEKARPAQSQAKAGAFGPSRARQITNRVSNPRTTNMGSRRNPIYVLDDDKVRCEGCWEEGHFIGDCNQEY